MRALLILILWQTAFPAHAQLTGRVTLPHAGVEFTIPEGWIGQQTEMGYILGSQQEAGAILLSNHESTSLAALKQEAVKGINEEGGTQLSVEGVPETEGENTVSALYAGLLQGQPVKGYAIGLLNPFGKGVLILAVTTPEIFSERHRQLAKQIGKSVRFFKAETSGAVDEWKKVLTNARLTYLESYNSSGGGYSDKIVIELCAAGYFEHSKRYTLGIDTGGAFANDHSSSHGAGVWKISQDAYGNPLLELQFNEGGLHQYTLEYVNGKTLLNGRQYFRTYDSGCQ